MAEAFSTETRAKRGGKGPTATVASRREEKERLRAELAVEIALGWLLHDVHRLFGKDFEQRIESLGLTRAQWRVLVSLERTEGGLTQTELADLTEIEKAPLGKTLDRLEDGGWIVRKAHPSDRRARLVYATSKIEQHAERLGKAAKGTFARLLQGVRPSEVKELIARLEKLKRNLGGSDD